MMKYGVVAVLLAGLAAACGRSPTSPSTPATPVSVSGTWVGNASDSSSSLGPGSMMGQAGVGTMTWQLTQTGSTVKGSLNFSGMPGRMPGSLSGTMDDDDMEFTVDMPMSSMMSSGCAAHATGTAHFDGTTMMFTGTYTGSNTCYGAFTDGQFTMAQR